MTTPAAPRTRSRAAVYALTALTMGAFAANSVLCRLALATTEIDAATFTAVRLGSGALALWLVVRARARPPAGTWASAAALFVYASAFSFAYLTLSTGTGALLLFGAVQLTMIGTGLARGERLSAVQALGAAAAMGGLVYLVLPGLTAPPLGPAALMAASGVAWGIYSLRGRGTRDATAATAGNFLRAAPLSVALGLGLALSGTGLRLDGLGAGYAALSGALTSGLGYVVWYAVLPALRAASAATVQLSVPVLAALGGVALLGEPVTLRLALAAVAVLGGIALVLRGR
ncbi:MAG: DMT family transporter [Rubricoccaceae bacterium]|nr:DMT family transporter [Rubricoccaceae bacterium]